MTARRPGSLTLEWGLKQSFLAYVSALPDGDIAVDSPAERDGGLFRLPGRQTGPGELRFDGALRFFGHAGVLDVVLTDIGVTTDDAGDEGPRIMTTVQGFRMPLAELADPCVGTDGSTVYRTVTLTDDGAAVLGGVYSPGAEADAVTINVNS